MRKSDKAQELHSPESTPVSRKTPYSKPELEKLGGIRDLTRMPGGSINVEGSSGKPHKQ